MLDFYLLKDEQRKPDYPEQVDLEFAGGLGSNTFENLKSKGFIEAQYDYYSDFRWSNSQIQQKYKKLQTSKSSKDTDVISLFEILEKARQEDCGLIAYCD